VVSLISKKKEKQTWSGGIKGLAQAVSSNKVSPEIVKNYTKTIFTDKLELLTGSTIGREEYAYQRTLIKDIVKIASQSYSLVLVDLEGDPADEVVSGIFGISNVIVSTLSQSLRGIHGYMDLRRRRKNT